MKNLESLRGKTLLIVEDEADLREPLAMEFESLGCKVFEAPNGVEGFDIVCREKIDVVISDIRMPGGDGIEMLRKIKARDHLAPVVMLITGFSDVSREEAYDLGAESILSKPFDLDAIEEAVERLSLPTEAHWKQVSERDPRAKPLERIFATLDAAAGQGAFALGRGGFFLSRGDAQTLGTRGQLVSFHIKFEQGNILLIEGTGVIRWVRAQDAGEWKAGCGIEFESLTDESKQFVLQITRQAKTRAYLPRDARAAQPLKES